MPLEKLILRNFGKFKKKVVEFAPTVTTIVGATGAGKTTILRALGLVCLNRPRGRKFVKDHEGKCRVALYLDSQTVCRKAGRGTNSYHHNGKRYVSFGAGKVPRPVSDLLRVCPINFQRQLDPVFLFSLSPGNVGRSLNEVVNLGEIDRVMAGVSQAVRDAERQFDSATSRLEDAEARAEELAYADGLARDFATLLALHDAHAKAVAHNALALGRIRKASELRRKLRPLSEAKADAEKLIDAGTRLRALTQSNRRLKKAVELSAELAELTALLEYGGRLSKFRERADRLAERNRTLGMYIDQARDAKELLCQLKKDEASRQSQLDRLSKERCPTCGQLIRRSS